MRGRACAHDLSCVKARHACCLHPAKGLVKTELCLALMLHIISLMYSVHLANIPVGTRLLLSSLMRLQHALHIYLSHQV